jgi:hypothetical protein
MTGKRSDAHDLWRELERIHGAKLPVAVRAFLIAQHGRPEPAARGATVAAMARTLTNLTEAGLWPAAVSRRLKAQSLAASDAADPRWRLERKLHKRRAQLLGEAAGPSWSPLQFARHTASGTIVYSFDRRLSKKTVRRALVRELPRLRKDGWLRAAAQLSKRELALLSHVCLSCQPEQSWRERASAWRRSDAVAAHHAWGKPYRGKRGARRFAKHFHRAEAAFAGHRGALAFCYDSPVAAEHAPDHAREAAAPRADHGEVPRFDLTRSERPTDLGRVAPGRGAALRERFAAGVRLEELVALSLAGDGAAGDEAIALCRRWRPAALPELLARLGRSTEV